MKVFVRAAKAADIPALLAIEKEAFADERCEWPGGLWERGVERRVGARTRAPTE
jgi:hypothetical protein